MHRPTVLAGVAMGITVSVAAAQSDRRVDLTATLKLVGERVERYFARAQSIVCLEIVILQSLGAGLSPQGPARTVESELRLSWDPLAETNPPPEARTLRQVLKINGHQPRKNDPNNCTTPEQNATETQPLSMLLPQQQGEYRFSVAGPGQVDRRAAVVLDFRLTTKTSVDVRQTAGNEDCISFSLEGGMRGRIWIDAETYDVLRLDQGLSGLVDIPLPRQIAFRNGVSGVWTMERWDSSIRFKPVVFGDPDETLVLPVSMSSLRITRGSGTPRLRTMTQYSRYKRFLTGGRIVKD